jgi:hypothetical protein
MDMNEAPPLGDDRLAAHASVTLALPWRPSPARPRPQLRVSLP